MLLSSPCKASYSDLGSASTRDRSDLNLFSLSIWAFFCYISCSASISTSSSFLSFLICETRHSIWPWSLMTFCMLSMALVVILWSMSMPIISFGWCLIARRISTIPELHPMSSTFLSLSQTLWSWSSLLSDHFASSTFLKFLSLFPKLYLNLISRFNSLKKSSFLNYSKNYLFF